MKARDKQTNQWYYDHNATTKTKQIKLSNGKVLTYLPIKRQVIYERQSYVDIEEDQLDELINLIIDTSTNKIHNK